MEESTLQEILESTVAVARGLEALQSRHEALITDFYATDNADSSAEEAGSHNESSILRETSYEEFLWGGGGGTGEDREGEGEGWSEELESQFRRGKQTAVDESLGRVQTGLNEVKLILLLSNYINTLESDKQKLKAQVKRLCSENNWLRKELTDHQQLLQETEIALAKVKEEKESMEFRLNYHRKDGQREREQSPTIDVNVQEEEEEEGTIHSASDILMGGGSTDNHLEGNGDGVDYQVPKNIKTLHHLAMQYVNQGKPDVAVPLCKKAIIDLEQKKGRDNPDLASMLNILAVIHRDQGKLKEATKVLHEALEIRERVLGPHHLTVASTLNNLSVLYGKNRDYKTAEPFCRKALEIRQRTLGANHPDVAKQFINLASLCNNLGRYDEVEYYYQRALEIYQTELGPDDPHVAKTMNDLAKCYLKQGKDKAAEAMFKRVLLTVQTTPGDPPAQVMTSSPTPEPPDSPGSRDKGVWSPPRSVLDDSFGRWHKTATVGHSPTVKSTLQSLSAVYKGQGRLETAKELDKLMEVTVLNKSQQDRIAEILSGTSEASDSPSPSPTPSTKTQASTHKLGSRASLSLSVRRLFRLKGSDLPEES